MMRRTLNSAERKRFENAGSVFQRIVSWSTGRSTGTDLDPSGGSDPPEPWEGGLSDSFGGGVLGAHRAPARRHDVTRSRLLSVLVGSLIAAALVFSSALSAQAATSSARGAKHKLKICRVHQKSTKAHRCIRVPKGVSRPHSDQNSRRGPKLGIDQDGLGATASRTQGAVDWAFQQMATGRRDYDGWCGKFVAHAFGAPALGHATAWKAARAFGLRSGTPPPGSLVFFRPTSAVTAGHVGIALPDGKMVSAQSNGIRVASLSTAYWRALYAGWAPAPGSWPGRPPNGAGPQFVDSTPPVTTNPAPPPTTTTQPGNRQGVASYDRLVGGAPHNGWFIAAWQDFAAQSNTLTAAGINIGSPGAPGGATVATTVLMRLCAAAPNPSNGECPATIAQAQPQIVNYGATVTDFGDVAVTTGQRYWLIWYQPAQVGGQSWATYWWEGGSGVSTSAAQSAFVRGYNR
jgi:hypothetical protein